MAAAIIALLTLTGGSLYASPYLFTSAQKEATATQFWGDADLFLSPNGYTSVEFDKWFGAVSFQSRAFTNQTQMMQLGFASQFGDLYAALYFGGNTFASFREEFYEKDENGKKVYLTMPLLPSSGASPHNEASVLIGIADMGFRLSYVHSYRARKLNEQFSALSIEYESFTDEYGSMNPEIAWGMTKELIPGKGIRPHAYIDLDFFRDYQKSDTGSGDEIDHSNNEFTLGVTAAAGYFSLFKQNGFDFGLDLWYTLNLKMFNNEYTPSPGEIVTFTGKYRQVGNAPDPNSDYYAIGYNGHWLTPYVYAAWSGGKLELSAELGLGLGLTSEKGMQFDLSGNTPIKEGFGLITISFLFTPSLDLGVKWAIVPDKFYLNAGSSIKILDLGLNTTTIDTYVADEKSDDTTKGISNTFAGASTSLLLGFTFNPTVNLGVQAMSGINADTNNISVFNTNAANGLAVFSKIMVTLKF